MSDQPNSRFRAKPRFSRRFLWLLILVLIPLIPFLRNLGPDEVYVLPERSSPTTESFDTDHVTERLTREVRDNVSTLRLVLSDASDFRLTVISDRQPAELPPLPEGVSGESVLRYGRWTLTLVVPYDGDRLETLAEYLQWTLPPVTRRTGYVLSGPWSDRLAEVVVGSLVRSDAPSFRVDPPHSEGVLVYKSPYPDEPRYWPFLLAMDLLDQRLTGYRAEMHWNHQVRPSEVALTTSLLPEQRQLPSTSAFDASRQRLLRAVGAEKRSASGWHQHLIRLAAYALEPGELMEPERQVGAITFEDFARTWENTIGATSSSETPAE